jgi:WD40 repeat protein
LVRLWSVSGGREIYRFTARKPPTAILESPGSRYLALLAEDDSLDVWDIGHPQELVRMAPAPLAILSPDGKRLATGGDGWLEVIDLERARAVAGIPFEGSPSVACWSPNGRYLSVAERRPFFSLDPEKPLPALVLDIQGSRHRLERFQYRGDGILPRRSHPVSHP